MSAHRILELEQVPGLGCSPIKAVRELGSERRETVHPYIRAGAGYLRGAVLVREDRDGPSAGGPVVMPMARPGSQDGKG